MAAASDPAFGSVTQMQHMASPEAAFGRSLPLQLFGAEG